MSKGIKNVMNELIRCKGWQTYYTLHEKYSNISHNLSSYSLSLSPASSSSIYSIIDNVPVHQVFKCKFVYQPIRPYLLIFNIIITQ